MSKYNNAKVIREQKKALRAGIINENNSARLKKEEEQARIEAEEARKKECEKILKKKPELQNENKKGKSSAKAVGVKSVLKTDNGKLVMTAFGQGNEAVPEKKIIDNKVEDFDKDRKDKPAYSVSYAQEKYGYDVKGRNNINAYIDDPFHLRVPELAGDIIHCRDKLEQMYFGRTFVDNIHIQLIYKIMDIEKIMAKHMNHIAFEIDNIVFSDVAIDEEIHHDFIGIRSCRDGVYDSFIKGKRTADIRNFLKLMASPQLGFYGPVLYNKPLALKIKDFLKSSLDENTEIPDEIQSQQQLKQAYYRLSILGTVRQAVAHGEPVTRNAIYKLDECYDNENPKIKTWRENAREALTTLYGNRVNEFNQNFVDVSAKHITIILRALDIRKPEEKRMYAQRYYNFAAKKDYKNLGFSIRNIREWMIEDKASECADNKYNTVRGKLYSIIDFLIFDYYQGNEKEENALVEKLRACRLVVDKELVYRDESEKVWNSIHDVVSKHLLPMMDGDKIQKMKPDRDLSKEMLNAVFVQSEANWFTQIIYLMTRFLDGKEMNDLITTLASQFDNIASFIKVMKDIGVPCNLNDEYAMFERSKDIADELHFVNSLAHMKESNVKTENENGLVNMNIANGKPEKKKKGSINPGFDMCYQAAQILGCGQLDDKQVKEKVHAILEGGEIKANGKKDKSLKNFLSNNIINSNHFKYIVRYCNPSRVRKVADNKSVIDCVLKEIPEKQIVRYYNSCFEVEEEYGEHMRPKLAEIIHSMSLFMFEDIHTDNEATDEQKKQKQKYQAIIRLYLTVLYLLYKNLIYVNARYFLAFHCAERDAYAYNYDNEKKASEPLTKDNYAKFSEEFLKIHKTNRNTINPDKGSRSWHYLQQNIGNSDKYILRIFRNSVDHLNAVINLDKYIADFRYKPTDHNFYFALYHFIMQKYLENQYEHDKVTEDKANKGQMIISDATLNPMIKRYFENVDKYGTYCKDFVKALCVPFAYNLSRYKNLSIAELFDKDRPKVKEKISKDAIAPEETA